MESSHLDELIQLEDHYWWHVAKRELVTSILQKEFPPPSRLVEGGIGSAKNLISFQGLGYDVAGFDIMQESVAHARQRGLDDVHVHDLSLPWPLENESVDVAVMLDVLEHLEDPVAVMRHVSDVLVPGGGIVFTVPAHGWLFGDWDRRLGHFRRYTKATMEKQALAAGFKVQRMTYWNAFAFPAAVAVRGYQKVFPSGGTWFRIPASELCRQ